MLPSEMPPRESRSVDALLEDDDGRWRIIEVDESQHFNSYRAQTFRLYPDGTRVAFPIEVWMAECLRPRTLPGGGFAKRKPPLFPMEGGRHLQRAFRDALADLLPEQHGFAPTLRLAHFELEPWIWTGEAAKRLRQLLRERISGS
jgi:hypothetical protein